ncbi:hypothetical protein F5Y02DRAFT_174957 [Annulohypoxylon stygium]|nr:hypothetical protein F5Y02DRAFT_174957 [Annulohypoxylon stygium]
MVRLGVSVYRKLVSLLANGFTLGSILMQYAQSVFGDPTRRDPTDNCQSQALATQKTGTAHCHKNIDFATYQHGRPRIACTRICRVLKSNGSLLPFCPFANGYLAKNNFAPVAHFPFLCDSSHAVIVMSISAVNPQ